MQVSFQQVRHPWAWQLIVMLFICLHGSAQQELPAPATGQYGKFIVPQRNREGVLIWQLTGDSAKVLADDKMAIDKVMVYSYRNSQVDWTLSTPNCILKKGEPSEAVSEADVRIFNQETEITGTGFHWSPKSTRFIIQSAVQVVIAGGITKGEVSINPASSRSRVPTTIRSDLLTFDYETRVKDEKKAKGYVERIAMFKGNVVAVDPQLTLKCKEMDVYFADKNNEVVRTLAKNDVWMYHEGKVARSEKAVFTKETGSLILSGSQPRLEDEKGNWILSRGDSIIYNIHTKRMDVSKPTVEMDSPSNSNLFLASNGSSNVFAANPVKGTEPRTKPFTKIDADLLNFDYEKHVAVFEGNVLAVDPQLTLKCKMMKVFFTEKNNEVIRLEAYQDVHMFNQKEEAFGDKAVFTKETGTIVLTGSNKKPEYKDKKGNWLESRGNGIIYNTVTKQMKVDKPSMKIPTSTGTELLPQSSGK